jgi:hypothetical protein
MGNVGVDGDFLQPARLVDYGERRKGELFLFVLPVIVSLSFFVIADLDSPLGGVIRVAPQNLMAASQSVK